MVAYIAWKVSADLFHCWNQVGDEDAYIAEQAHTIDMLDGRFYEFGEKVTETSNEVSMIHDYVSGVHYALVEGGDFLRKGLGMTNEQWIHLNTLGTRQHSCTSHYGDTKVHASGETACGCNWNSRFNRRKSWTWNRWKRDFRRWHGDRGGKLQCPIWTIHTWNVRNFGTGTAALLDWWWESRCLYNSKSFAGSAADYPNWSDSTNSQTSEKSSGHDFHWHGWYSQESREVEQCREISSSGCNLQWMKPLAKQFLWQNVNIWKLRYRNDRLEKTKMCEAAIYAHYFKEEWEEFPFIHMGLTTVKHSEQIEMRNATSFHTFAHGETCALPRPPLAEKKRCPLRIYVFRIVCARTVGPERQGNGVCGMQKWHFSINFARCVFSRRGFSNPTILRLLWPIFRTTNSWSSDHGFTSKVITQFVIAYYSTTWPDSKPCQIKKHQGTNPQVV